MYFIKVNEACLNVLGVVYFIRELLKIAYIVVPAGLIVMISFDFVKGVINFGESNTKALTYVVKRLINSMLIFLIPSLVFTLFYILDFTSNDTKACWNYIQRQLTEAGSTDDIRYGWNTGQTVSEIASGC